MSLNNNLSRLKRLIQQGKIILKKSHSINGSDFGSSRDYERKASSWYIQATNFLSTRFGPKSLQSIKFQSYFHVYKSMNLLGMYGGEIHFIREDIQKGLGHLEGIHESLESKDLKTINPILSWIYKFWIEVRDLIPSILKIFQH